MIYLYSGVPGSGKSYHATMDIREFAIEKKLYVITNLPVDYDKLCKHSSVKPSEARKRVFIKDNEEITVDYLSACWSLMKPVISLMQETSALQTEWNLLSSSEFTGITVIRFFWSANTIGILIDKSEDAFRLKLSIGALNIIKPLDFCFICCLAVFFRQFLITILLSVKAGKRLAQALKS